MRYGRPFILPALVLAALQASGMPAAPTDKDVAAALATIRPADGYEITRTLASREFGGRLTGHEGYAAAARWAAGKLRDWGLRPISAKGGYLQPYPSPYTIVDRAEMTLYLAGKPVDGKEPAFTERKLVPEKEFLPLLFSDSGDRTAELVFAGWGISAPELGYDDYAGIDVRGKFVLCFRGTPEDRPEFQHHDEHRTRMAAARDRGALGLVYIYPETASNPNGDRLEGFTPAEISEPMADLVLAEVGGTSAGLKEALETYKRPISFPLRSRVRLAVASRTFPDAVGYNVVGWVEGSDPKLRKECLVVGGHFDHNGTHMGLLFPGADDNASGSAAVLQIARAFAALGRKPKRSVVFALFGGEEMGLQGSAHFASHVPGPFSKVDAMFNFDMVGEGDGIAAGVGGQPEALEAVLREADARLGVLRSVRVMRGVGVRGSDFAPFFVRGVPCASFFSNGPHLAYHQTGDTIYRINPDIIADAARLAFLAARAWADRQGKP